MVENIGEKFEGKNYTDEEVEKILFDEIIMQERNEISNVFSDEAFLDFKEALWETDANIMTKHREIPNSSIFLNNKIVEILNYYRAKGQSFYQDIQKNSIAKLILEKVFSIYNQAFKCLNSAMEAIETTEGIDDFRMNVDEFTELYIALNKYLVNMFKYQKISDKELWKFDIEKHIVGTIFEEFINCKDKGKYIAKLKIYLEDLKKLRIKKTSL